MPEKRQFSLLRLLLPCLLGTVLLARALSDAMAAAAFYPPSAESLAEVRRQYGDQALQRIAEWQQLISAGRQLAELEKLKRVNVFFNRYRFISDTEHWGSEDYWATPLQMLASNGGDCEDFSIAKYFTLQQMGVPVERLRLTYVKALELDQAHMVLTYFSKPDAEPLVLDNLVSDINPASERDDLLPVYSFNGEGLWLATERGSHEHVGRPERLSHWKSVVARIGNEQIQTDIGGYLTATAIR